MPNAPKGYISDMEIMKRLGIGDVTLKAVAQARGWQKEGLGKRKFYKLADIERYERRLSYPTPEPKPKAEPPRPVFGRRRGAGSRTEGVNWNKEWK
jgi:hypothetical protein